METQQWFSEVAASQLKIAAASVLHRTEVTRPSWG